MRAGESSAREDLKDFQKSKTIPTEALVRHLYLGKVNIHILSLVGGWSVETTETLIHIHFKYTFWVRDSEDFSESELPRPITTA